MKNGIKTKVDIAILQEQMKTIKENDLKHLGDELQQVKEDIGVLHVKIDKLTNKVYYAAGGVTIFILIAQLLISHAQYVVH